MPSYRHLWDIEVLAARGPYSLRTKSKDQLYRIMRHAVRLIYGFGFGTISLFIYALFFFSKPVLILAPLCGMLLLLLLHMLMVHHIIQVREEIAYREEESIHNDSEEDKK